ncbi:MAG TPA: hypothetical protein VFU71_22435, partial [Burkholderiaceae bacterium]|nr:hypothetical protein [Burkholderiaceae bacterium]
PRLRFGAHRRCVRSQTDEGRPGAHSRCLMDDDARRDAATPEPFLHLPSGTVRFWVLVNGQFVGASIRREVLHYRYHATQTADDPMVTYAANVSELHAAVQRRVAKGSIEPVMLRDADIAAAPRT